MNIDCIDCRMHTNNRQDVLFVAAMLEKKKKKIENSNEMKKKEKMRTEKN